MNKKEVNDEYIIELYKNGKTLKEISLLIGHKSYGPTRRVLKNNGFNLKLQIGKNTRKKKVNEEYFDVIDSSDKAYILGWIISDGYINNYKLTFCLKDLEIIQKIKNRMESDHKITHSTFFDKRTNKNYNRYFLQISSKKIVNSLKNLGIHTVKSFTATLPIIPYNLYSHLIRGIFDGDGYAGKSIINEKIKLRFSLIISERIYVEIEKILNNEGILIKKPIIVSEKNNDKIMKLFIYKLDSLKKFFNYIYFDCSDMKLERKFIKYNNIINLI